MQASFIQSQKAKPAWLVYTENLLMRCLVDIATGTFDTLTGLHKFFSDWDLLYEKHRDEIDEGKTWFADLIPGMLVFPIEWGSISPVYRRASASRG